MKKFNLIISKLHTSITVLLSGWTAFIFLWSVHSSDFDVVLLGLSWAVGTVVWYYLKPWVKWLQTDTVRVPSK